MSRPPGRPRGPVPPHGTRHRYQLRYAPCRCDQCRAANADAVALWRARHRAVPGEQLALPRSYRAISGHTS